MGLRVFVALSWARLPWRDGGDVGAACGAVGCACCCGAGWIVRGCAGAAVFGTGC